MAFQNITGLQWVSLGSDALQVLQIDNEFCTAQVALQGAQVLQFYSKQHQRDVLWLSDGNSFVAGKAIRGGIPLCFPWFGAHAIETDYPAHGFARNMQWQFKDAQYKQGQGHSLTFELRDHAATRRYWDAAFCLEMHIRLGQTLELNFRLNNLDLHPISFGFAWHSYFAVKTQRTRLYGVEGCSYIDQLDGHQIKQQDTAPLEFHCETDQIYPLTKGKFRLDDSSATQIVIETSAQSAVVWNPWIEKTKRMADLAPQSWQEFVCVEAGQVATEQQTLLPEQQLSYQLCLSLSDL